MKITNVSIQVINNSKNPKLKGFASLVFDDCFVVRNIRIIEKFIDSNGDAKLFAAMPNERLSDGSYVDLAFPINQETRDLIENAILSKYADIVDSEKIGE